MRHISAKKNINNTVENFLADAYRCFEIGDLIEGRHMLNQAQTLVPHDKELQTAVRACVFWEQRLPKLENITDCKEKGNFLQRQWENFEDMCRKHFDHTANNVRTCFKVWAYSTALKHYKEQIQISMDTECMLQASRCMKVLGYYEEALASLENAVRHAPNNDARYLAEMANAAMLIGKERIGKILMREALFIDASRVEVKYLDAPVFKYLIERMKGECPVESPEFNEWLPIYGTIWGVFDVKRELETVEYDRLNQKIHELSTEISDGDKTGRMIPKLINSYFWLIDHCEAVGNQSTIIEALAKIKHFAPKFYDSNLNNLNNRPGRPHV